MISSALNLSGPAQRAFAKITGMADPTDPTVTGTPTLSLQAVRVEDPLRELVSTEGKAWDDPEVLKARKRLGRKGDEGLGIDEQGRNTLDGRTCCFDLISGMARGELKVPESQNGETESDGEPVAPAQGLRFRCPVCRAVWEYRWTLV